MHESEETEMLISNPKKTTGEPVKLNCDCCGGDTPAVIVLYNFGNTKSEVCFCCAACAMQLARKFQRT
jgi:hypothetical protein